MAREERRERRDRDDIPEVQKNWAPKTELGRRVQRGEILDFEQIFREGHQVREAEITDHLLPQLETDYLLIGQAKGKFGGGQRRIFRQTQKKTKEGNKLHFSTLALVGNKDGYVGMGMGRSKETVPARDKSLRNSKVNIIKIRRGCGSWECGCRQPHSIPFAVEGKSGSCQIKLLPAPKGKGLCIEKECAKVLAIAGITDIWSRTSGQSRTKINLIQALFAALKKLSDVRVSETAMISLGVCEGKAGARP